MNKTRTQVFCETCTCSHLVLLIDFSVGVGRTGVFIALSIVLERMRYEGLVDLFQTVKMLRTQRPAMVQNEVSHISLNTFNEFAPIHSFIHSDFL